MDLELAVIQILRKHWRSLLPWDRSVDNRLSLVQRTDYLLGGPVAKRAAGSG
ncbi:MAG: hypothetical protein KY393_09230 [Actinobacteria bacterium]|nr:hypothetical protein [Actinomycetota bacterium]